MSTKRKVAGIVIMTIAALFFGAYALNSYWAFQSREKNSSPDKIDGAWIIVDGTMYNTWHLRGENFSENVIQLDKGDSIFIPLLRGDTTYELKYYRGRWKLVCSKQDSFLIIKSPNRIFNRAFRLKIQRDRSGYLNDSKGEPRHVLTMRSDSFNFNLVKQFEDW